MQLRGVGRCPAARNCSPSGATALRTGTAALLNATVTSLFVVSPKCREGETPAALDMLSIEAIATPGRCDRTTARWSCRQHQQVSPIRQGVGPPVFEPNDAA
jgi:hypothetical protein